MATKPRKPRNVIGGTIDKQLKEAFSALPKEQDMTTVPLVEGGNVQEVILDVKEGDVTITVTQESSPVIDATPAAKTPVRMTPAARAAASQKATADAIVALGYVPPADKKAAEDKAGAAAAAPVVTKVDIGLNIAEPTVSGISTTITATEAVVTTATPTAHELALAEMLAFGDHGDYCRATDTRIAAIKDIGAQQVRDAEIKKAQKEALEKAAEEAKAALAAFNKAA